MKHATPLLLLVLAASFTACQKADKEVVYRATGNNASVRYVDENEVWQSTALSTTYRVELSYVDTVIAGTDTTVALADTIAIPEEWSYRFDAPHDGTARMVLTQDFGNAQGASATLSIDGGVMASGSVAKYRDQVTLTP